MNGKYRIFMVEDNLADVFLIKQALKAHAVECSLEQYTNGEEAARALDGVSGPPSLFLLDLNLPRLHGLELLRIIRSSPACANVPVAIFTSSAAAADKIEGERLGADVYIVKPLDYHEFLAVGGIIKNLLQRDSGSTRDDGRAHCCPSLPYRRSGLSRMRRNPAIAARTTLGAFQRRA